MHIRSTQTVPAFANPNGETIHELVGARIGGVDSHSVAKITLAPGRASLKHYHPIAEESYYILAGQGRVELDGETQAVKAGDTVYIPAGAVHQIWNPMPESLVFLAVCAPAWTPDNSVYVD
jgi:mannose-6-phosphate isomerase-like protein (cupin superfamily)